MNRCKPKLRIAITLLAVVALPLTAALCPAGEASQKVQKSKGVVTEVTVASLTIEGGKEGEVKIYTGEDYLERVSVGMQVTAWHHEQGGVQQLDRLEYPLEVALTEPGGFIPRIKRFILLPSSNAGDASTLYAEMERLFRDRFHWVIADRMLAEEVRRRFMKEQGVNTAIATRGNETTPPPLVSAEPELIQRIAQGARADAVLEVRVEYIMLKVRSHTAEWDGQRETFGSRSARFASAITRRPVRGQVPVATVVLNLFDPQGRLLWRNRRGFRVLALQVSMGNDFRDRPLAEAVQDSAFMNDWLNQVFASWLNAGPKPSAATAQR
ncbi:MAG: hypothetical protein HY508_12435 [Acidobacteria bacterium]|nr:hypothetical protein [Acidobacteriota bacterium]